MSEKLAYSKFENLMGAFRRVRAALRQDDSLSAEELGRIEQEWLEVVRAMREELGPVTGVITRLDVNRPGRRR